MSNEKINNNLKKEKNEKCSTFFTKKTNYEYNLKPSIKFHLVTLIKIKKKSILKNSIISYPMSDIQRELEKFSDELNSFIGKMDSTIVTSLEDFEKRCLDNSMDNADRYVDCMSKSIKRIEKEEARFQFRLNFTQHRLHECLLKQQEAGSKNFEVCKKDGLQNVSKYVEDLIKSIKS